MTTFREYINEMTGSLQQLQRIVAAKNQPVYIVTAGIQGSGKSTFAIQNFENIEIVDLDEINKEMVNGDMTKFSENRSKAIAKKNEVVKSLFNSKKSFIDAGTAANVQATLRKLKLAKSLGYITAVVYVNIPIDVALERNRERLARGSHGVPIENEMAVINRTDMNVRTTIREINNNKELVDFFIEKRA